MPIQKRAATLLTLIILTLAIPSLQSTPLSLERGRGRGHTPLSIERGRGRGFTTLTQDAYGFIWIGTENGLNRYDGYRYTTYLANPADTTTLPSNEVTTFLNDRQGRLWVGCNKGLALYLPTTNTFRRYTFPQTTQPRVESIIQMPDGSLLIGTAGYGLYRLPLNDNQAGNAKGKAQTSQGKTQASQGKTQASNNPQTPPAKTAYLTSSNSLFHFSNSLFQKSNSLFDNLKSTVSQAQKAFPIPTAQLQHLTAFSRNNADEFASRLFIDSHNTLWRGSHQTNLTATRLSKNTLRPAATYDYALGEAGPVVKYIGTRARVLIICMYGILAYDYQTHRITPTSYDLSRLSRRASIRTALLASDGTLYLGTSGQGVYCVRRGQTTFTQFDARSQQIDLNRANVNDILEDRNHNIWFSCYNKGLYQVTSTPTPFHTATFTAQDIRLGSSVSSIAPANDGGTWLTIQKSAICHLDPAGQVTTQRTQPDGANTIYRDQQGHYWLGTEDALYAYDPATGAATQKARLDGWGINAITDDAEGNLYISNFGKGLVRYNTRSGQMTAYTMNDHTPTRLHNDWVKALLYHQGQLYIACADGLSRLNTKTNRFTLIKSLSGQQCLSLVITERKTSLPSPWRGAGGEAGRGKAVGGESLLIGTDHGLYRLETKSGKTTPYPGAEPLAQLAIYAIVQDRTGDIWASTPMGIWQLDQQQKRWRAHIAGSGLAAREYVIGAAIHDTATDNITFAIGDGITTFHPDNVRHSTQHIAQPLLTRIVIGGHEQGCAFGQYDIDYQDNTLQLEFSQLNFLDNDNITYQYRLSEKEPWTTLPDASNRLTLTKMEPGTYHLQVRATSGGNNSPTLALTLRIAHPWYATPLAWTAYAILAALLIALVVYYIDRRRKIETEEAKMRFLINATHDIRSPLTLILGPLTKLKQRLSSDPECQSDIDTIDRNAQRLLLLVNQILDERRIDKNQLQLHPQPTDLVARVTGICSMYQYNAHQRAITLSITHKEPEVKAWIDPEQFDKVIANLLSNAFKYTLDGGQITIDISQTPQKATLRITDTGPGLREPNPERLFQRFYQGRNAQTLHIEGTGIGLNLAQAIVRLHQGTITAQNRTDGQTGAIFEVTLPTNSKIASEPSREFPAAPSPSELAETPELPESSEQLRENPSRSEKSEPAAAGSKASLLIVDDDPDLADYVAAELSRHFRTTIAHDGQAALDILHRQPQDLVITDVVMPGIDGLQLLRAIKTNPRLADTPVILLTSKAEVDHRIQGIRRGADAYIAKPFDMQELRATATNLIDNVRRLRGKFSGAQQQEQRRQHIEAVNYDDELMQRIMRSINAHISDPDYRIDSLTQDVGISRAQLHRKLKELTGLPAGEFLRNLRLDEAARLLQQSQLTITQVADAVGFSSQSHFSTLFHKRFGQTPKEYQSNPKED